MAIQYSGAAYSSTFTTTTGTRREIVDLVAARLVSAGWSYQSGSGTGDVKMLSATTPQSLQTVVRIDDPGSGNCARFRLGNVANTVNQAGGCFLLPAASKVFQIVANPYQFCIFVTGSTTARDFIMGGTPWIPSWNSAITSCGWIMGNAQTDSDTTMRPSFRTQPTTVATGAIYPNMAAYINSTLMENNNTNYGVNWAPGVIQLMGTAPLQWNNNNATTIQMSRWFDTSGMIYEPIIGWANSVTPGTAEAVAVGQLWDAAGMTVPNTMDLTSTFDTHNWINIMSTNNGSNQNFGRSCLFLATT